MKTPDPISRAVAEARSRGMTETCLTCRFWTHGDHHADHPAEPMAHFGTCRRYPPARGYMTDNAWGWQTDGDGFPITDGGDWCGEWKATMSDHEITGLVAPLPDTLCRYRIGHESGEVFDEGDDYDGLTLTIEIDTLDQGLAFVAALRDRRDEASEWKAIKK